MIHMSGYILGELVGRDYGSELFKGERIRDGQQILIKRCRNEPRKAVCFDRLNSEYETTRTLGLKCFLQPHTLEYNGQDVFLVLEAFDGIPLSRLDHVSGLDLYGYLQLALALAEGLGQLHSRSFAHLALTPDTILVDQNGWQIKFISPRFISPEISPEDSLHGLSLELLAYMAPEQTGRILQPVDHRSDLYALGIILYQLLADRLPFAGESRLALIAAHISEHPTRPLAEQDRTAKIINDIVLKLLEKGVDARYQSAYGLLCDLRQCLIALETGGPDQDFTIGRYDIPTTPRFPTKLYGRQDEIGTITSAINGLLEGSKAHVLLVSGPPGCGKSSLVQKTMSSSEATGPGYVIHGKFVQYRDIPYSGIVEAFQGLIRQLLTKSESRLKIRSREIAAVLGENGRIIIDVLPEVELLIGPQPPVVSLPPDETRNRFNLVFQKFISIFVKKSSPLLLFLDDLQWMDTASQELVESLLVTLADEPFLLLGAFRDTEMADDHPLQQLLHRRDETIPNRIIALSPLTREDLLNLLADTLHCQPETITPMADLLINTTDGNPFFAKQLILTLFRLQLLTFDPVVGVWTWNLEAICDHGLTEDIVSLMTTRIRNLTDDGQKLLKFASCLGNRFDTDFLAALGGFSPTYTTILLQAAVRAGLLLPCHDQRSPHSHRFLHDRIQQAGYSLIPENDRPAVHLRIARLLTDIGADSDWEKWLYTIADQFLHAIPLIAEPTECRRVAALFLKTGRKAKAAAAYNAAAGYLEGGLALLTENGWQSHYALTYPLSLELAESLFLCARFEEAAEIFQTILDHTTNRLDRAEVYALMVVLYEIRGEIGQALTCGRKGLQTLGFKINSLPLKPLILTELAFIKWHFRKRKIETILTLPEMTDSEQQAIMNLLIKMVPPAYFSNRDLLVFLLMRMVRMSLECGNTPQSPYAYMAFGCIIGAVFGEYENGRRFGEVGLELYGRLSDTGLGCKLYYIFGALLSHWTQPAQKDAEYLQKSLQLGLRHGDLTYAAYSVAALAVYHWSQGEPLDTIKQKTREYLTFCKKARFKAKVEVQILFLQAASALSGETTAPDSLSNDDFNEEKLLAGMTGQEIKTTLYDYYLVKQQLLYLNHREREAFSFGSKVYGDIETILLGKLEVADFYFYHGLVLAKLCRGRLPLNEKCLPIRLRKCRNKLYTWSTQAPFNFRQKYLLLEAEAKRNAQQPMAALQLYNEAIETARENGYLQDEAIAHELAARFYLSQGLDDLAAGQITTAVTCYEGWGAQTKVTQLREEHPQFFTATRSTGPTTEETELYSLDLQSIFKAARALTREMELKGLLEQMLRIIIENAGAQRGVFVTVDEINGLFVLAEGAVGKSQITIFDNKPVGHHNELAISIINFVARTGEEIVLAQASTDPRFAHDPYLSSHKVFSLLCLPVTHQEKIVALLYLENNLITGVFTDERVKVLKLLASQIAISLENSRLFEAMKELYQDLSREIKERKKLEDDLREREQHYRLLAENITDVIWTMDLNLRYTYISPSVEKMRGFTAEEAMAMPLHESMTQEAYKLAMGAFAEEMEREEWPNKDLSRTRSLELDLLCKDGTTICCEVNICFLYDPQNKLQSLLGITRDIRERKVTENELQLSRNQLRNLSEHLQSIREEEKTRIARNIHDDLGQALTALDMDVSWLARKLPQDDHRLQSKVRAMSEIIDTTIASIQRICTELRPAILDHFGIGAAIEWQVDEFAKRFSVISYHLSGATDGITLPPEAATAMFRICQEALTNIARHAKADAVEVILDDQQDSLILEIRDNGIGIEKHQLRAPTSIGIHGMQERIRPHGGQILITRQPFGGTLVRAVIPKINPLIEKEHD
ncbi:MAG: AAA family ATPase [Proteobacteria bacterium]|nr:AAA family ATPase [Pseudomonadota bacterium]MBU1687481.1 AAA family ATPase [Pseudomonadota bacterium]